MFNICKGKTYFNNLNFIYFNKKIIQLTNSYYDKNKNLNKIINKSIKLKNFNKLQNINYLFIKTKINKVYYYIIINNNVIYKKNKLSKLLYTNFFYK